MTLYFFAMDRDSYAHWLPIYLADMNHMKSKHPTVYREFMTTVYREFISWLPIYLADMNQMESKHPTVYREFMSGNHVVS